MSNVEKHPILTAVDFSVPAAAALAMAGDLAARSGTPLVVLHVIHDSPSSPGEYHGVDEANRAIPMQDVAQARLDAVIAEQAALQPDSVALRDARSVLVSGLPADRILEVAEREGAEMIVIGSSARPRFSRLLKGSVAEAVVRRSRIPVTVCHDDDAMAGQVPEAPPPPTLSPAQ